VGAAHQINRFLDRIRASLNSTRAEMRKIEAEQD
jgi:hypothetical protein